MLTDNNRKIPDVGDSATPHITSGKTKLLYHVRAAQSNSIPYVRLRTQYNSQDESLNACSFVCSICVCQTVWPTLFPLCRFYSDLYHTSHADRCAHHQVGHHAENINHTCRHRIVRPNIKHRHGIWKFSDETICYWRPVGVYVTIHIPCRRLVKSTGANVFLETISTIFFHKGTTDTTRVT